MTAIAGRHLYSGRRGDVETGFIMQQDDVRQFAYRMASRKRYSIQVSDYAGVRLQESVVGKLMDRLHAGPREF